MSYESWRSSYQSSEQAARAAFDEIATLRAQLAAAEARAELWQRKTAVAWEVCASTHRAYAKHTDPLFTTRQSDFMKHAAEARAALAEGEAG